MEQSKELLGKTFGESELVEVLHLVNSLFGIDSDKKFNLLLKEFADFIGFEFVLYAYVLAPYDRTYKVVLRNISNPVDWMKEYERKHYLENDPLRYEMERRISQGQRQGVIRWNEDNSILSPSELEVVIRREHFGLRHGFSAYCDSVNHRAAFMVSFASKRKQVDERVIRLGQLIAPHLNRARKRLDLLLRLQQLTNREQLVADLMVAGKKNAEIAQELSITPRTVKYHLKHILEKLEAANRQQAISIIVAAQSLA